jgi:hypothetical protein
MNTKFLSESLKGRDHFGNLDAHERIILQLILKKQGVDWIQDDVHWRAVVTTVMNVMLLKKWAIS